MKNGNPGKASVIGIGRVGLPLGLIMADAGFDVFGVDVRQEYVDKIARGELPFIEGGAEQLLRKHVNRKFFPTTDISKTASSEFIVLTLGTPVDEHLNPDYRQIDSVMQGLFPHLRKGQSIILRSTVAPGTTEYLREYIEKHTKMKVGKDIFLAFCPERIAQGMAIEELPGIPQIVGGIDEESTRKAAEFFSAFTKEQLKTDARSAELAKIFTNMYRYINFSIANEFMILAEEHERDIYEIINLINKNYKRGGVRLPGYAAGPCLYKDGFFLINAVPFSELISVSWKINETTPLYLLNKIKKMTPLKDRKVVVLGMAFKADNDDMRQSLSFKIKKALQREHAQIECHDPFVKEYSAKGIDEALRGADVVIVGTNHTAYKEFGLGKLRENVAKGCIVCDVWNVFGKGKIIYRASE